jgi:hypothetical protein
MDAYFAKGKYKPELLILELFEELPPRPRAGRPDKAAVWVKNDNGFIAATCTDCLRIFPVTNAIRGVNTVGVSSATASFDSS